LCVFLRFAALVTGLTLPALTLPSWAALSYTCDPNVNTAHAGTCDFLNTTIAAIYNNTFTNVNAKIYVQYGKTGLGQSTVGFDNQVTYSAFLAALTSASQASGNAVQQAAVKTLNSFDTTVYGQGMVDTPSALLAALGIPNSQGVVFGTKADGQTFCTTLSTAADCYNGIVTITNDPGTHLYFRTGTQAPDAYDFYSIVEHETNEILGTSSCIATGGSSLSDGCPPSGNTTIPSAADLFRFQSAGTPVLMSTTPGAYFSFNGGQSNGAGKYQKVYNTLSNDDDYADFLSSKPCQAQQSIQDAEGCPGFDGNLDITNDGGAEINILNAIGYKLASTAPVISSIQNAATFQTAQALAPNTYLAVFGNNLSVDAVGRTWAAPDFIQNGGGTFNIPAALDGTSVTVGGIPGYVYYVGTAGSGTQLNILTPSSVPPGNAVPVVVTVKGQPSAAFNVNLNSLAPAFFAYYPHTADDGKYLIAQHLPSFTDVGKVGLYPSLPANTTTPAKPGETIQLYGTGFGPVTPAIPAGIVTPNSPTFSLSATATLGGQNASVIFAGLTPTLSQIYQVDVTIPNSATAGLASGATTDLPLVVTVGGVKSFSGLITVQAP
jgi:uncharacterized protein (TIGR03437 family)